MAVQRVKREILKETTMKETKPKQIKQNEIEEVVYNYSSDAVYSFGR